MALLETVQQLDALWPNEKVRMNQNISETSPNSNWDAIRPKDFW